jgi:hypothetical protein
METGPLAVWLWNALTEREVPIVCIDARHANGVLKMMPNKTDRHDARGLAQIVRTGWFKAVQIKSHDAYVNRAMLTAREALVGMRVKLENEIRGLLKTFGIMFGKRVGGFKRRAEEIIEGELAVAPELLPIFEALMQARRDILGPHRRARQPDPGSCQAACDGPPADDCARRGTDHGDGGCPAFDDAARFRRSSSAGAYLGLTPRRYESGEISRNGRCPNGETASPGSACSRRRTQSSAETSAAHAAGLGQGDCRENRTAQGQGRAGPEAGGHPARHVAHQHALPGGRDGIEPQTDLTLIFSTTECVQPGRAARVRSLPRLRQRPRTPLRSTRP